MLNLNDLKIFVQVVDHGGFAPASRALGLPKQTLSKRLAELEMAAGVRLIQRTSRSFVVTELGKELYRHAAAMLVEADAAEQVIQGRLSEPSGTVRITASVPTVQSGLGDLLPRVASAYPKIRVELHASDRFVDVVQEGFDIALRAHVQPLPDSGMIQRKIGTEDFWLIASPVYCRGRMLDEPRDLEGLAGIFSELSAHTWVLHGPKGEEQRVMFRPRYFANESTALISAAGAGLGVASVPSSLCQAAIRAGTVRRVLPHWTSGSISTTLLMPHRRGLLPSVRIVADLIAQNGAV